MACCPNWNLQSLRLWSAQTSKLARPPVDPEFRLAKILAKVELGETPVANLKINTIHKAVMKNLVQVRSPKISSNLHTVLCSYRERSYRERIVIFREIISASIGNKSKICVTQKKYFCDRKKWVIWLKIWLERTIKMTPILSTPLFVSFFGPQNRKRNGGNETIGDEVKIIGKNLAFSTDFLYCKNEKIINVNL